MKRLFCCRRSIWCVLDTLTHDKVQWICDRHDRLIAREYAEDWKQTYGKKPTWQEVNEEWIKEYD